MKIEDFRRDIVEAQAFVAGTWQHGATTTEVRSPWDNSVVGRVAVTDDAILESATQAAQAAERSLAEMPRWKRAEFCRRIAEAIAKNRDLFAQCIVRESGKPLTFAQAEVTRAVSTYTIASEEATRLSGEQVPLDITPASEGLSGGFIRVPSGPVCAIAPFNFPLNLVAHKLAPALAVGCPVVLKPAPQTPLTSLLLATLYAEAEVPPGALSVLPMNVETAERMARDDRFALLTFTGSARVGWHLKAVAGRKKVTLELGGNAAVIVHGDTDPTHAARRCAMGAFAAAGQVCIKAQRILVERTIYDAFVSALVRESMALPVGDPRDANTIVGPLIDEASAVRVTEWTAEAVAAGARLLLGGTRDGAVVAPTILSDVPHNCRAWAEEIFGPVVSVDVYDDFDSAIALANASRYGLQAGVFTRDIGRIRRAISELRVGGVIINDLPMVRVDNFPYGGVKASGFGREGVRYAMEDMTEMRMVVLRDV